MSLLFFWIIGSQFFTSNSNSNKPGYKEHLSELKFDHSQIRLPAWFRSFYFPLPTLKNCIPTKHKTDILTPWKSLRTNVHLIVSKSISTNDWKLSELLFENDVLFKPILQKGARIFHNMLSLLPKAKGPKLQPIISKFAGTSKQDKKDGGYNSYHLHGRALDIKKHMDSLSNTLS